MLSQASVSHSIHSGGRVSLVPGPFLVTGSMSLLRGRLSGEGAVGFPRGRIFWGRVSRWLRRVSRGRVYQG